VTFELDFGAEKEFDSVVFREPTNSVESYKIYASADGDAYDAVYESGKMGKYILCYINPTRAKKLRIDIERTSGAVGIDAVEVYNEGKRENSDFRVVDYLYFSGNNMLEAEAQINAGNTEFSEYFDVVTDIVVKDAVKAVYPSWNPGDRIWSNTCQTVYYPTTNPESGLDRYAANIRALERMTEGKNIRLWLDIDLLQSDYYGNPDNNFTAQFLERTRRDLETKLRELKRYGNLYGFSFTWNYPYQAYHWRAVSQTLIETDRYASVAFNINPWDMRISGKAKRAVSMFNIAGYNMPDGKGFFGTPYSGGEKSIRNAVKSLKIDIDKLVLGIRSFGETVDGPDITAAYRAAALSTPVGEFSNKTTDGFKYIDAKGNSIETTAYFNEYAAARDKTLLAFYGGLMGVSISDMPADAPFGYEYSLRGAVGEVIKSRKANA
jgi:hypothetical protein